MVVDSVADRSTVVPASYLYLLAEDRVLLQQRRNTGYVDGHWVAGAAGHVELGETAAACAVREAAEELGIMVAEPDLQPLTVMQRTNGTADPLEQRIDWFFAARRWHGQPRIQEPDKCAALAGHSLTDLPSPMPDYEQQVLHKMAVRNLSLFSQHGF